MNSLIINSTTPSTTPPNEDASPLKQAIRLTNIIYPLMLSLASTVSNVLSFAVFSSRTFEHSGSSVFFRTKSLVDMANVYVGTLRFTYTGVLNLDLKNASKFWCYSMSVCVYAVDAFASWLNVLVSVDRLVLVFWPIAYKTTPKPRLLKIQLAAMFVSFALISVITLTKLGQLSFTVQQKRVSNNNNNNKTDGELVVRTCSSPNGFTFDFINVTITLIIPFVLMAVSSALLAVQLVRSNSRILKYTTTTHRRGCPNSGVNANRRTQRMSGKNVAIIRTVICLDVCFLVFNFPRFLIQFVKSSADVYTLVLQYSTVFKYSYYSFSIFFYVAANNLFRARAREIVRNSLRFELLSTKT